ncbi:MAG: hypothetical protein D8M26_13575 [Ignavibacteriae bacterium]|nr:hypothetical protein [Ignavibacteriota bacterium]MCE7855105.1 hypothetical protein [Ignavibacteria bacterium CHB3]GJQ44130.1 MAG: hypothetical protein JETCAE03_36280 [Ignavibacteriaceae bacterium]
MGILFELRKTDKTAIYLYSLNEQHNFIDEIKGNFPNDHSVLSRNIELLADRGEIRDEDKFKHVQNSIFEFKTKKLRVFCLLLKGVRPKTFILNHYYKKQGQKTPTKEINKAQKLADEIIAKHKSGELQFGE